MHSKVKWALHIEVKWALHNEDKFGIPLKIHLVSFDKLDNRNAIKNESKGPPPTKLIN